MLTSGRSFSAAESLAYTLQSLGRATIVGEATGGAANPVGMYRINAHLSILVTNGRAIHPITGSNWEGTGVIPDIVTRQEDAVEVALVAALEKILKSSDPAPPDALIDEVRKELAVLGR